MAPPSWLTNYQYINTKLPITDNQVTHPTPACSTPCKVKKNRARKWQVLRSYQSFLFVLGIFAVRVSMLLKEDCQSLA